MVSISFPWSLMIRMVKMDSVPGGSGARHLLRALRSRGIWPDQSAVAGTLPPLTTWITLFRAGSPTGIKNRT